MFIHIGGDKMVRLRDIIGIFDIHTKNSNGSQPLFRHAEANQLIMTVDTPSGEMKSIVLTDAYVYMSPISSLTLKRRASRLYGEDEIEAHGDME